MYKFIKGDFLMRKLRVALITLLGTLVCVFASLGIAACNKEPEVATYTVTFVYNNGVTQDLVKTVNEGDTVAKPENPTREGYTFAQWYNGETQYDFYQSVTSDLTLTAHWTPLPTGVALTWTANEATEYVYAGEGTLPTSVEKNANVSFKVKQINPFYTGDIVVTVDGTALDPVDGVYTFTADAAKTIAVSGLTADTSTMTGTGTEEDPYVISTAYQLKTFSDLVNAPATNARFLGKYVELGEDIDYCGYQFTPIGDIIDFEENFIYFGDGAQFDGKGHTIKNIQIVSEFDAFGLFGYAFQAVIQNVNVEGLTINPEFNQGYAEVGGILAYNFASDVVNCSVQGNIIVNANSRITVYAGGVCGFMQGLGSGTSATIQYCTADVTIQSSGTNAVYAAGGIAGAAVGVADNSPSNIYNCVANVTTSGQINFAGGIVGLLRDRASVTNCFTRGQVRAEDKSGADAVAAAGAIAGVVYNDTAIVNCYSYAIPSDNVTTVGVLLNDATKVSGKYQPAGMVNLTSRETYFENSYRLNMNGVSGDKSFRTAEEVLENMNWSAGDWEFVTEGQLVYPAVKYNETVSVTVTLDYNGEQVKVTQNNETTSRDDLDYDLTAYVPAGFVFDNMLQTVLLADSGNISYGVFFDAELKNPVPAAYLFTKDVTVYAGFADYSAFDGEYIVGFNGETFTVTFETPYAHIPFANGGKPVVFVYFKENIIRLVEPSIFDGDGDYVVIFDNETNTITITDFEHFGEDGLKGYLPNEITANWYDENDVEYKFKYDYTGTKKSGSGDPVSFTYEVAGTTVTVTIGEDTIVYAYDAENGTLTNTQDSNDVLNREHFDEYHGVWEYEYSLTCPESLVIIDGQGKIFVGGDEFDYTINGDTGALEFLIDPSVPPLTAQFNAQGFLTLNGMTLFAENSFAGTWYDSRYGYEMTFNGLNKNGMGVAIDNLGNTFLYESVKSYDTGSGTYNVSLNMYLYISANQTPLISTAQFVKGDDGDIIRLGLPLGANGSTITFQLCYLDAFEGEWIVGSPADSAEISFKFNGRGAYDIVPASANSWSFYGQVTVSAVGAEDVTIRYYYQAGGMGTFTYKGTEYDVERSSMYGEDVILIGVGGTATYILYRADMYAHLHLAGDAVEVILDGSYNENLQIKGLAEIFIGKTHGYLLYEIDEDENVILYNNGEKAFCLELDEDKLFEFKAYDGNTLGEAMDYLGLYSNFLGEFWFGVSKPNYFAVYAITLDGIGVGSYNGQNATFTYENANILIVTVDGTKYSLEYQAPYVATMFNLSSGGTYYDRLIVIDDFQGEYTAEDGTKLEFDGLGNVAYFFDINAEAVITVGEGEDAVEISFIYVINPDGTATLKMLGGDAENPEYVDAYTVYLKDPEDPEAVEYSSEYGSVWLVEVHEASEGEVEG